MEPSEVTHQQHSYAKDAEGNIVLIRDARSGRGGYYCFDCHKELQAVHRHVPRTVSYFRHDPKYAAEPGFRCAYSDETTRHQLGKQILQRLARIKVPAVVKRAPDGQEGAPMVISVAKEVHAHVVRTEVFFFLNEQGGIGWSQKRPNEAEFLIRVDVAFFDKHDNPTLLIELAATHRVDEEKRARLILLGIDAVEVSLPTGYPEEIEEACLSTERTKWLHNEAEHKASYVRPTNISRGGVQEPDGHQGVIPDEKFGCRRARIGILIRAIEKCLGTEQYCEAEYRLESDISRAKERSKRTEAELRDRRSRDRTRIEKRFAEEMERLGKGEAEIEGAEAEFGGQEKDLERRYHKKAAELDDQELDLREQEDGENLSPQFVEKESERVNRSFEKARFGVVAELRTRFALYRDDQRNQEAEQRSLEAEQHRIESENERIGREEENFPQWSQEQELAEHANYAGAVDKGVGRIKGIGEAQRVETGRAHV